MYISLLKARDIRTYSAEGDESVLSGVDAAVIRSVPPDVCSAVHQPRGV